MRVWHKPANETEILNLGQPWYFQPEPAEPSQTTPVLAPASAAVTPTHFEPDAAERILARAGLLQETHRQNLSKEQVEAIAAEIGIAPEFVRLAMEQEAMGILPRQQTASDTETMQDVQSVRSPHLAVAMGVYGVLGTILVTLIRHYPYGVQNFFWAALLLAIVPAVLALVSGFLRGKRRQGLAWGAGFGIAAVGVGILSWKFSGDVVHFGTTDYQLIVWMVGIGALLGLVGAETRRQVSRRRVRYRGRRTVRRTETP